MALYNQLDFSDGMDLISSDVNISAKAYRAAFNIRQRYGHVEGINKSINVTYNLSVQGKAQGIYGAGAVSVAFYSGRAYYRLEGSVTWIQIIGFSMDDSVDIIYAQAVPQSTNNFGRQAIAGPGGEANASGGIVNNSSFVVNGTSSGLVCQDGINQPYLISYDPILNIASARLLQTYDEWENDNTGGVGIREYVPIGTKMMYLNGVLYIVNGNNQVYRSVSGRPLDFMVNIDTNGNKLSSEALGGASTTSFAVDAQNINCITPSVTTANAFIVGTALNVYTMQPDFNTTIFGEPTFDVIITLQAGIVNQFCVTAANGDTPFIDFEGVTLFNAVQSLRFEGRNSPFSKNISAVLKNITQNITCCTVFDNYNLFAILTSYGYVIAVYDNITEKWVGFDLTLACSGGIKMFAQTTTSNATFLYAVNSNNQIWQLYNSANTIRECSTIFLKEFISGGFSAYGSFSFNSLTNETKLAYVKVCVTNGAENDMLYCRSYVNDMFDQDSFENIPGTIDAINYPVRPPVIPSSASRISNLVFTFDQGEVGYKIQPVLSWTSDLTLERVEVSTAETGSQVSASQQQTIAAN